MLSILLNSLHIIDVLIYLGWGAGVLIALFTLIWLIQLRTKNAAIVDPIWSLSFPLLAVFYFLISESSANKILFLAMICIWGIRLGAHLMIRVLNEKHEDARYTALRNEWGDKQNILMLRFYYFQALLAVALSIPFVLIMIEEPRPVSLLEMFGVGTWLIAVAGESIADAQLKSFKADPKNKGKVCQEGLWNYSRHPNYFFEWLIWVAFFVFALAAPFGWVSIICPAMMLFFLLKITGIPYTETQSVKSKGQAYIEYQKTTSAFVPLPKKRKG
jgi:steroid 5-alpha reductase family enzyme